MNEEKTISKEKLYSVLESLISHNVETEDVYFLSLGFYTKKEYELFSSMTNSELLFSKTILPLPLRALSFFISSHIGFIRLGRTKKVVFELLFFPASYASFHLVFLPKCYEVKSFISDFQTRDKRRTLDEKYKSITFEILDEDEITYFTHFDELEILAKKSIAKQIDLNFYKSFETETETETENEIESSKVSYLDLGIILFIVSFFITLQIYSLKERENNQKRNKSYEKSRSTPVDTSYLQSILKGKEN